MNRIHHIGLIILLASAGAVCGEVYVMTNNISALTNAATPALSFDRTQRARVSVFARYGDGSLPLNVDGYSIEWEWTDPRDGQIFEWWQGYIQNPSTGHVVATAELSRVDSGSYDASLWAVRAGVRQHRLAWNQVTVTGGVATSGGVSVSVTTTANVSVVEEGVGNVVTGATANGSVVTVQRGTVAGGGGGSMEINGYETSAWSFVAAYPIIVSNVGNTIYWGFTSLEGGIVVTPDATNVVVVNYISATTQVYTVPLGVTQLYAYCWGAAGGAGSAGGYAEAVVPVLGGESLILEIGQGAHAVTGGTAAVVTTATTYPQAGLGVARKGLAGLVYSGGGRTAMRRGTNYIVVAGGGGGQASSGAGGNGGGISGADGTAWGGETDGSGRGAYGLGGDQSEGGRGWAEYNGFLNQLFTNTSGGHLRGGHGGVSNNAFAGYAGGGGDGWKGGGGGYASTSSGAYAGGGAGSGYVNLSQARFGTTVSAVGGYPPAMDHPHYQPGWGVANNLTHDQRQNHGGIILMYEVSP
jgi:hypothetical protein